MVLQSVFAEPQYNPATGKIVLSANQIANDLVSFHKVLQAYPCFQQSRVVGPDIVAVANAPQSEGMKIIQA